MFYPRRRRMKGTASHACPPSMFDGSELTWFESHKFMSLDGLGQVSWTHPAMVARNKLLLRLRPRSPVPTSFGVRILVHFEDANWEEASFGVPSASLAASLQLVKYLPAKFRLSFPYEAGFWSHQSVWRYLTQ